MNLKRALIYGVVGIWLAAVLAGSTIFEYLNKPLPIDADEYVLVVPAGGSVNSVSRELQGEALLNWPKLFVIYARITQQTDIKVGEYALSPGITSLKLLTKLVTGDVIEYNVTIPEGLSFKEVVSLLAGSDKLNISLQGKSEAEQLALLGIDQQHPEGWFFPDTYRYALGDSDVSILQRAYGKMQQVLDTEWQQRDDNLPYTTPYEALIMASIIEKETGVESERATIAGVFVKRLQKGMRLQTDPTVIYGLGDSYQGNIKRSHLKQPTAYNTYVIKGLPPTPIAMPGQEAIRAALQPEENPYYYFVARGDGSHYFSATLEEHLQAVKEFQINNRVNNYQSRPVSKN